MSRQIVPGYGSPTVAELEARVTVLETSVRTLAEAVAEMAQESDGKQAGRAVQLARRLLRRG